MIRIFPLIFVLLWSSAFITTKPLIDNSDPFSALAFRFSIVTLGFLIFSLYSNQSILIDKKKFIESFFSGVLFHGIYLGGVFYSISIGMPKGIAALIVTLQPILTNLLSGPIYKEVIGWRQWVGIVFGFVGSLMVLGIDFGNEFPKDGIITCFIALTAITAGTLWQKKLSGNVPLSVNNGFQAFGGCFFNLILILILETPYINFTTGFILGMTHQIILVSFGAFTILMFLIKAGSVSKTSTLFFLVPPTTALMAYLFLGEKLSNIDVIGFVLATIGVYIATRK